MKHNKIGLYFIFFFFLILFFTCFFNSHNTMNQILNQHSQDEVINQINAPKTSVSLDLSKSWRINNMDRGNGIDSDSEGNIYMTGVTEDFHVLTVKFDKFGNELWYRTWGTADEFGQKVRVANDNSIFVLGVVDTGVGIYDISLLNYNSSGSLMWTSTWGDTGSDTAYDFKIDENGNFYTVGSTTSYGGSDADVYLCKLNSTGSLIWNITWGGSLSDGGTSLELDSSGNIYVAGYTTSYAVAGTDYLIAKFNNSGDIQWYKTYNFYSNDRAYGIDLDSDLNLYVAGTIIESDGNDEDSCLVKYNSSGDYQWEFIRGKQDYDDYGRDVAVDSEDNVFFAGYLGVGGGMEWDVFLWKINASGFEFWNETYDSGSRDIVRDLNLDAKGNIYVAGWREISGTNTYFLFLRYTLMPGIFTLTSDADDPDLDGSFNLNWTASEEAVNYSLYTHNSTITEINGTVILLDSGLTNLSYTFDNMNNGTYFYLLVAFNAYGNSSSNCLQVNVQRLPPGPFILSTTAGTPDIDGIYYLNWTSSNYALNYSIYNHTSYITDINGTLDLLESGLTNLSYSFANMDNGTYYYKVLAFNENGNTSSICVSVEVKKYPPEPFNLSGDADDPDSDGNFILNWSISNYAKNYSVCQSNQTITTINENVTIVAQGLTGLTYPISGLPNGTHYFMVIAFNDFGNMSSNNINVEVFIAPPGPFNLSSNATNPDTDGAFTLFWNQSSGAINYTIYWAYTYITEFNVSVFPVPVVITDLFYPLAGYPNGDYYFIVVARNNNGNSTTNNIQISVRLAPKPFSLSSNADSPDDNGGFTLNWSTSLEAVNYSVYYSILPIDEINGTETLYKENITELLCPVSGFSNGTYFFVVLAFNNYGNCSSNNIQIIVQIPPEDSGGPPSGDDILFLIVMISIIIGAIATGAILFIVLRKKQGGVIELREGELPNVLSNEEQKEKPKNPELGNEIDFT